MNTLLDHTYGSLLHSPGTQKMTSQLCRCHRSFPPTIKRPELKRIHGEQHIGNQDRGRKTNIMDDEDSSNNLQSPSHKEPLEDTLSILPSQEKPHVRSALSPLSLQRQFLHYVIVPTASTNSKSFSLSTP